MPIALWKLSTGIRAQLRLEQVTLIGHEGLQPLFDGHESCWLS